MADGSATPPLHPGATVRVQGHKARSYLNGKEGTCIEKEEDGDKWLMEVRLTSKKEQLKLKPEYLVVVAAAAGYGSGGEKEEQEEEEEAEAPAEAPEESHPAWQPEAVSPEQQEGAGEPPAPDQPGLQTSFEYAGSVGLLVHRRPEGAPPAPFAVVLVPGNPGLDLIHMGKFHSQDERLSCIAKELHRACIPFVQFDYEGIFLSAPEGPTDDVSKWKLPENDATVRNPHEVFQWAKQHLNERLVLCTWNFGFHACRRILLSNDLSLHACVAVSMAYNFWLSYKVAKMYEAAEVMKQEIEACVTIPRCRLLFVVGNKDFAMTPIGHVKRLIKARDGSCAAAEVHEIDQKQEKRSNDEYFNLAGHEEEVGQVCGAWLASLGGKSAGGELESRAWGA